MAGAAGRPAFLTPRASSGSLDSGRGGERQRRVRFVWLRVWGRPVESAPGMRTRRDSKSTRRPSEQVREITLASNMTLPCAASPDLPAQIAKATATTRQRRGSQRGDSPPPARGRVASLKRAGWGPRGRQHEPRVRDASAKRRDPAGQFPPGLASVTHSFIVRYGAAARPRRSRGHAQPRRSTRLNRTSPCDTPFPERPFSSPAPRAASARKRRGSSPPAGRGCRWWGWSRSGWPRWRRSWARARLVRVRRHRPGGAGPCRGGHRGGAGRDRRGGGERGIASNGTVAVTRWRRWCG